MIQESSGPRILLLDIETAPVLGWSWKFYDINLIDTLRDWTLLCYGAQWIVDGVEQKPFVHGIDRPKDLFSFIKNPRNDEKIVKEIWHLLDQADYVVAHNGNSFDLKKVTSRFLTYGLGPPSPYKQIDTLQTVKRISQNTRNNQGVLLKEWGIGFKMENEGFPLWLKYMGGEPKAIKKMHAYNRQDVVGLLGLFKHLRPWIKMNHGMYTLGTVCPHCGSRSLQKRGVKTNNTTEYHQIFCNDCRGWSRSTVNERETKPLIAL